VNSTQNQPVTVIDGLRDRFPKVSDALAWASSSPEREQRLDEIIHGHLQPLLNLWLSHGRPDIEWPEPSGCP
jgi:hypothetical protein